MQQEVKPAVAEKPWPAPGRIPCCVVGCRRTASVEWAGGAAEIICGIHWRTVPRTLRRRHSMVVRIAKRAGDKGDRGRWEAACALEGRIWAKIRTRAIEIAMGISA